MAAVLVAAFSFFIGTAAVAAAADLNKEFSDGYFRLRKQDADIHIKVSRKSPQTKVDPIGKQDQITAGKVKKPKKDGTMSIKALGKILQISIVVLLGLLIYTLSQRSKKKNKY